MNLSIDDVDQTCQIHIHLFISVILDDEVHQHDNFLLVRSLDWGVFMVVPTTAAWFQARQDVQILS